MKGNIAQSGIIRTLKKAGKKPALQSWLIEGSYEKIYIKVSCCH